MRPTRALGFACLFALTACGSHDVSLTNALVSSPRAFWEEMAPVCAGHPSKEDCDDGDMTLFGGLLCASGDERGCRLVRESQSESGRWWRSPRRRDGNLGGDKSFSRDMSMGVLLYLAKTRDALAAERWLEWIEGNRPCVAYKPDWLGGGCLVRGVYRFCTDDENGSCSVSPNNWALMADVWDALGLELNAEMEAMRDVERQVMPTQARNAPHGYESHLVGVQAYLKEILDVDAGTRREVANILAERQPDNPFYVYLDLGPSTALWERVVDICPSRETGVPHRRNQWAWERDTAGRPWESSSGWDCLFLANVLGRDR